jgi:hypothetical protein
VAASDSFLHGDENNANVAGGTNGEGAFVNPGNGSGVIPSYMVVNMQGTYHLGKNVDLFARAAARSVGRCAPALLMKSSVPSAPP